MSTSFLCSLLLYLILLSSISITVVGRDISIRVSAANSPSVSGSQGYVKLKPELHNARPVFGGREVKSCLPKGLRHSSAPSHYVNYHPLGSAGCSSSRRHPKEHWRSNRESLNEWGLNNSVNGFYMRVYFSFLL